MAQHYTLEEQIVSHMAREFGPSDEFAAGGMSIMSLLGVALAMELYAPRLIAYAPEKFGARGRLTRGLRFPLLPGKNQELWIASYNGVEAFEKIASGKWCNFMGASQIDMYGNANLCLIGDKKRPTIALQGSRGMPCNTTNAPRQYYWIPQHTKRLFVEKVDYISGVGYTPERLRGELHWGATEKVFSNLGAFDFDKKTGRMRLHSLWSGISLQNVVENTGFELLMPKKAAEADQPTAEELHAIRDIIDPLGVRRLEFANPDQAKAIGAEIAAGKSYRP